MNPKAKTQTTGFHNGPYAMGTATLSDITVTATNSDGETIVVGRFPFTRQIDAEAQARAYSTLPSILFEATSAASTCDQAANTINNDYPEVAAALRTVALRLRNEMEKAGTK
jgi:hypothetical protein